MSLRTMALMVVVAALSMAQEQRSRTVPNSDIGTTVEDPQIDYFDSAADYFRYSPRAVEEIHKRGTPAEEVAAVLYLARFSKMTANQVLAARKAGKTWQDLARDAAVKFQGDDFVAYANAMFLSRYHSRPLEEVKRLHADGATWVAINQQYRREGVPAAK
jgi:hypothetical protein